MKTMLFNPYNGLPRHPSDIQSDPQGLMMVDPDEPLRPAPKREPLTGLIVSKHFDPLTGAGIPDPTTFGGTT